MLSRGHYDCVIPAATGCPVPEFKVLGHAGHSQALHVAVLRKGTPKVVQSGGYLGENKKAAIQSLSVSLNKMIHR